MATKMEQTPEVQGSKKKSHKKVFIIVGIAIVLFFVVMAFIGGSDSSSPNIKPQSKITTQHENSDSGHTEESDYPGLQESSSVFGLSTMVSFDEFIELFNTALVNGEGIKRGDSFDMDFAIYGGLDVNNMSVDKYDTDGYWNYTYNHDFGHIDRTLQIAVDSETDNVIGALLLFDMNAVTSNQTPESAVNGLSRQLGYMLYALNGGNETVANEVKSKISESTDYYDGIVIGAGEFPNGIVQYTYLAMTEDAFAKFKEGTLFTE